MNNNKTLHPITQDKFLYTFKSLLNNNGIKKLITITNYVVNKDIMDNKGPFVISLISSAFLDKNKPYASEKLSEIAKDITLMIKTL